MSNTNTNELVMMGARVPRVLRRQAKRKAEDTGRTLARYIEDLVRADLRPVKRGSGDATGDITSGRAEAPGEQARPEADQE